MIPTNTKPIKQNLFRFVTVRPPQQATLEQQTAIFITHPNLAASFLAPFLATTTAAKTSRKVVDRATGLTEALATFDAFTNYRDLANMHPELYKLAEKIYNKKATITADELVHIRPLNETQKQQVWNNLLYDIMAKKNSMVRQACLLLILADNFVVQNMQPVADKKTTARGTEARDGIRDLTWTDSQVYVEVPKDVLDLHQSFYDACGGQLHGVTNLGIADYRRVEQEICCYVPGEVSHIENILAREYKEKSTRNLLKSEYSFESTRDSEIEHVSDTSTTTRNQLSSEIASVIASERSLEIGASVGYSSPGGFHADGNIGFSSNNSNELSNTAAKEYAQEVTNKALDRIVQKTSEKRSSKIIKEFEENNKHGFDNRLGTDHVTGVYRWVDIIYKNRLVNYGKRLMLEFMVPEPATFFKTMLNYNPVAEVNEESTPTPTAPKSLPEFGINSPDNITEQNAQQAGSYYGVNITTLPPAQTSISKALTAQSPVTHKRSPQSFPLSDIIIPAEYEADKIIGSYKYKYRASSMFGDDPSFCDFTFGNVVVSSPRKHAGSETEIQPAVNINIDFNPNLSGSVPVTSSYEAIFTYWGAVEIKCVLKESVLKEWRATTYNNLLTAYNNKLSEFQQDAEASQTEDETSETPKRNPAFNRITEQRELKRAAIEMITKPFCREQGKKMYYDEDACGKYQIPKVLQTPALDAYTAQVKFMEQAIDWNLMSYMFYPYYWADKCDWAALMQSEDEDVLFQAFLQAGMARVVVPVRTEFAEAIMYYMRTGDIWMGSGLVPGTNDALYLSIIAELATVEGAVEGEWETRVPSTLTIVQAESATLKETGLPCCHEVTDAEVTNIEGSTVVLSNVIPTP